MHVRATETEGVDQHQFADAVRTLQRQLQGDPAPQGGADHRGGAQPARIHVALDEAREIWNAVASARLFGAAETWKVGRVHTMPMSDRLQIEAPLDVTG